MSVELRDMVTLFRDEQAAGRSMVLAVAASSSSALRQKPGAMLLVNDAGEHKGSLAGREFSEEVAARALEVLHADAPLRAEFDLAGEYEMYLGEVPEHALVLEMIFYPLHPENQYEPLCRIVERLEYGEYTTLVCIPEDQVPDWKTGDHLLLDNVDQVIHTHRSNHDMPGADVRQVRQRVDPPLHLLVFGGGEPSRALVDIVHALGWQVSLIEDRPDCLEADFMQKVEHLLELGPDELEGVPISPYAVIMPHDYQKELAYLEELSRHPMVYVGVGGLRERSDKLLFSLAQKNPAAAELIGPAVRAPAGMALGASDNATRALAIVAEIQQVHAEKRGAEI